MRLIQLTGKSRYRVHPKHLIKIETPWYFKDLKKTDVVIDLGCSNGQHSLRVAKKCKNIIGVDHDIDQLKIAKAMKQRQKIKNARFVEYDLEKKLPFDDNYFDKVMCLDVLEHIERRKQLLTEIKRILKPKGIAFMVIPNADTSWKKLQKRLGLNYYSDPDHKTEYRLPEIKKLLRQTGFKLKSLKPVIFDSPWIGFIDILGGIFLDVYAKISLKRLKRVENNLKESIGFRIVIQK